MVERRLLAQVAEHAGQFLQTLDTRPVREQATVEELRKALGGPLPDRPTDPSSVISALIDAAEPGIVASAGPRYFGFVVGGALPAALAADWLAAAWDQNAGLYVMAPSAAVVEEVALDWLAELLGLPASVSAGFVTGAQMANVTALAAARHAVLARAGWDVERDGLQGAPRVRILAGEERHATIDRALRLLGLGISQLVPVPVDDQGRMRGDALVDALSAGDGPAIVCTQAGNVNTGAFDPFPEIAHAAEAAGAWLHVDGAFGLWAAVSPSLRHLVDGVERADSWATDAHKWLNVPYDSGLVLCADPAAHRGALALQASYLPASDRRDGFDWTPEASRRARGLAVYAAIRSLGRSGIAELVEGTCAHARRFAEVLGAEDDVEILNHVVLNQVLVRFRDSNEVTREVIARVQADGTCWVGGTTWRGAAAMRISVSNWRTSAADVDRSAAAILRCSGSVGTRD